MINEERVKHMTRMAIFEKEKGPEYQPMLRYSRKEYIALHGWGGFFAGTIFFAALYTLFVMYLVGSVLENVTTMYVMLIGLIGLLAYAAYIIMHIYNTRRRAAKSYKRGSKLLKELRGQYETLEQMYSTEEAEETPKVVRDTIRIELDNDELGD